MTLFITMFLFHLCMAVGRAWTDAAVCVLTKEGGRAADRGGAGKQQQGERLPGAAWPDHCMMTTTAMMNSTGFLKRK